MCSCGFQDGVVLMHVVSQKVWHLLLKFKVIVFTYKILNVGHQVLLTHYRDYNL